MSLRACDLCGNTKRAHRSILAHGCSECGATICARHARSINGKTICTRCVRSLSDAEQATAMRVAL